MVYVYSRKKLAIILILFFRLPVDLLEVYTFESNNPFLDDVEQYEKGQQAYKEGSLSNAILYLEAAVLNDANNFMVIFQGK